MKSVAAPVGDKAPTDPVRIPIAGTVGDAVPAVTIEDVTSSLHTEALEMFSKPQPTTALCDKDGLLLVEEMEPTVATPAASPSNAKNVQLSGMRSNNSFATLADVEDGEAVVEDGETVETTISLMSVLETLDTVTNLEEFIPVVATKKGRGRGKAKGNSLATREGGGGPKL